MSKQQVKQYKVGDKVTIRSWESMEKEFGLDSVGDIETPTGDDHYFFLRSMREYCGKTYEIDRKRTDTNTSGGHVYVFKQSSYTWAPYFFTDWEGPQGKPTKTQRLIKSTEKTLEKLRKLDELETSFKSKQADTKQLKQQITQLKQEIGE